MASRASRARAFAVCAWLGASAALPGCGVFGPSGASTVAQGKYYSSGDPQYDKFFIELYELQVLMEGAPRVPDAARQNLAQALGLPPKSAADAVGQRLRDEAVKLSQSGQRLRLEQDPSSDRPDAANAAVQATFLPTDSASAPLIAKVGGSATTLLRSVGQMRRALDQLNRLELAMVSLNANVEQAFAQARLGKRAEVEKNLSDAQKLIALMKARANDVSSQSAQLLAMVAQAIDTDDGTLNALVASKATSSGPSAEAKRSPPRMHAKSQPKSGAVKVSTESTTPAKAPPATRDFEP